MKAFIYPNDMYTFRFDSLKTGTDIDFVDVDHSLLLGYIKVQHGGYTDRRTHVLTFYNEIGTGAIDSSGCEHTGFDITTTGTIEFMLQRLGTNSADFYVTLYDGATRLIKFQYEEDAQSSNWDYDNGGGMTEIYGALDWLIWYIIRIDIDIDAGANGQFSCYVYDDEYTLLGSVTNVEFENNATTVDELHFDTEDDVVARFGVDCIGITAEGGYTQGDIQYAATNVSDKMENTRIHDGIIPYKKYFTFDCHPNYEAYFNKDDYIDILDDSNNILFTGYINTKSRNNAGIYKFKCSGMANEIFERTYDKSFSSDKTSEKLQDIIDNGLEFCYRDSSITATTTDYSYEYNRACIYIFNLARYLERQVVYIEPDGKVISRDYDDLVKASEYYLGTHNFRDEADGTSGTDIDFVDNATLYNGACHIISDWQGHRKVLRLTDDATPGEDPNITHIETQATAGTREFWVGTNDVTEEWDFYLFEAGHDYIVRLRITDSALDYRDSVDAWQEIQAVVNDTLYHLKIVWRADNTFDVYVDGILQVDNQATNNNQASGVNRFIIKCWGDSTKYIYLDAYGDPDNDANYNVGDNLLAGWYLYDGNQNVILIDIPGLQDAIPGYYFGNTGITSVSVRYKDNTTVIRPATPIETFKKKRLKEWRDPKLQAATEANQLGDNLYSIFSADTKFLGLMIKDEGWLQPGKVIAIINTNQIIITANNFLIVKFIYDPKNDVYINIILSDNIITPKEFKSDLDTSNQQIHTATLQSFENQSDLHTNLGDLGIGSANKRWKNCVLEGSSVPGVVNVSDAYRNIGAADMYLEFGIPLDYIIGIRNLVITRFKIGIAGANATNKVTRIRMYGWSDHDSGAVLVTDDTDRTIGEHITDHADETIGGNQERVVLLVDTLCADAEVLVISYVQVEYYYG